MATTVRKTRVPTKRTKKVKELPESDIFRLPENKVVFHYYDENKVVDENATRILQLVKQAHDILYKGDKIAGELAMKDIVNILFLTMISKKLSDKPEEGKIYLWNKDKYVVFRKKAFESLIEEDLITDNDLNLLAVNDIVSDLTLIHDDPKQDDLFKRLGQLLTSHPDTKMMFPSHILFNLKKATTLRDLVNCIVAKADVDTLHQCEDLIGDIYEYFMSAYQGKSKSSKSKMLGQFFTPRKLMKLVISFLNDHNVFDDFLSMSNVKVVDRCMGTAGWLVTFHNLMKDKFKGIHDLRGCEHDPETSRLAMMNLINATGKVPKMETKDSLTNIENEKYHIGLYNPPFGADEKYENLKKKYARNEKNPSIDDVYKMKSSKGPLQFIDSAIYTLEDNGVCVIVVPYGEIFYGENCKKEREYLVNTVDISHIFLVPGGIFTHAGVKTVVMVFRKGRPTQNITYLSVDMECTEITNITTISGNDVRNEGSFSLYHTDYLKDKISTELKSKLNCSWVPFGEMFSLEKGKTQSTDVEADDKSDVLFVSKAENEERCVNTDVYIDGGLFIANAFNGNGTCPIKFIERKCIHSNLMSLIKPKGDYRINLKFVYYYLKSLNKHIEVSYNKGACNSSLDIKNFNRMEIPIPPMEIQEKMIKEMEVANEKIYRLQQQIENIIKENTNKFLDKLMKPSKENKNN